MSNTEIEIWKDIENYPNYMVSNLGRIKSLNYNKTGKEKILKLSIDDFGYCRVRLYEKPKSKFYYVHKLVASAFIPNLENKPYIDHIDTNPQNNNISNLRWVTQKENCNNPVSLEKYRKCKSKPLIQLSISNDIIKIHNSIRQVQRELGFSSGSICDCCNKKNRSAYNYKWVYLEDYINEQIQYLNELKEYRNRLLKLVG